MKKIIQLTILILTATILSSCSLVKKINRNKAKEETKEIAVSKLDSINETNIEEEVVSTFVSDSTAETIDLSTETTTILFNDSGDVKSIVTTKKTNIKSNVKEKSKVDKLAKVDVSKFTNVKKDTNKSSKKKVSTKETSKDIKRDSSKSWFWIIVGFVFSIFILVAIYKIRQKYFSIVK